MLKDNAYYEKLSEASKQTLVYQGGQMNQKEADHFEKSETFQLVLKMRDWDDKAKNTETKLALQANELLAKLKNMLSKLCSIEYEDTNKQF
jgi:predicted HD phosphohydrolase